MPKFQICHIDMMQINAEIEKISPKNDVLLGYTNLINYYQN